MNKKSRTISGTATNVLRNIPSITVAIEGNVSLSGNTFTLIKDGNSRIKRGSYGLQFELNYIISDNYNFSISAR